MKIRGEMKDRKEENKKQWQRVINKLRIFENWS